MAKKTNVSIEFEDLNPSDLSKVTDLIDTLGYAIVGYSITTPKTNLRSNLTPRGRVNEVDTPYAPVWEDLPPSTSDEIKSDVEGVEAVPLEIQASVTNVSPVQPNKKDKSVETKSNLSKYL